jgi:CheY-like chemotaxis protein
LVSPGAGFPVVATRQTVHNAARTPGTPEMNTMRVLIIEDDPAQASLIQRAFTQAGLGECELAHTGLQALEIFDSFRPHVVVTDVMLPLLNGLDCARALRERDPEVVIVGYSAVARLGRDEDRRLFDAWMERHPTAEAQDLVKLAQEALARKRA